MGKALQLGDIGAYPMLHFGDAKRDLWRVHTETGNKSGDVQLLETQNYPLSLHELEGKLCGADIHHCGHI